MNNYCGFNNHTKCIGNNRTPISTILPDNWNNGSSFPEEDDSPVALDELQYDVTLDGYYKIFDSCGRMPIIIFSLRPSEGEEKALEQERNIVREQQEELERAAIEFGYKPNWTNEIFTIIKINKTSPVTYKLKDYQGNPIQGSFYTEKLQKVRHSDIYLIEKVLKRQGNKMYVKYLGFDSSHNQWIDNQ
ncbi:uncharacterized protein LOC122859913 [Aphidius gifuensis]|uniref:uncharacterized protein LOC122859913 n=1 Tax=Aphidius gifuensis TaxID=684658 RepID=UPI001CDD585C|nr:uncharacterized protein LOC122859913 [Aphidius gifuensis]